MELFSTYNNYKKYENEYLSWQNEFDRNNLKRIEYLKNNPLSDKEKENSLDKGLILLNAIDIMDEYSQAKAEDTEAFTNMAVGTIQSYCFFGGMFVSALLLKNISALKKYSNGLSHIIGGVIGGLCSIPFVLWATKAQIGASRQGRFEAMRGELQDPVKFAILTKEQKNEVDLLVQKLKLNKNELKNINKSSLRFNPMAPFNTIKELLKNRAIYKKQKTDYEIKKANHKENYGESLTEKQIIEAKKDKQLLSTIINKIDIASQDYAENVEMFTNISALILLSIYPLNIKFVEKALKLFNFDKLKINSNAKMIISSIVGLIPSAIGASFMADIQKEASRIARFKIKQELNKDLNNFAYVEDEKIKELNLTQYKKKQKTNLFNFFVQTISDYKDYKNHIKTKAIENKKYNKAKEKIQLSAAQKREAKRMQANTFKFFNEVDDMSQRYAENVEALGEIVQNTVGTFFKTLGILCGGYFSYKKLTMVPIEKLAISKFISPMLSGVVLGTVPSIFIEMHTTKEQKKASRVANMLAIEKLNDYKNFVDFSEVNQEDKNKNIFKNFNMF